MFQLELQFYKVRNQNRFNLEKKNLFVVTAIDGDRGVNNPIKYSLSSNSIDKISDVFTVDENTGTVLTTRTLDRESLSMSSGTYILQITVGCFCKVTELVEKR